MKKVIMFLLLAVIAVGVQAQTLFGYYYNGKPKAKSKCEIKYMFLSKETSATILIESVGVDNSYIAFKDSKLDSFVSGLKKMRDKYIEWSKTAKENNIKSMTKEMDYPFEPTGFGAVFLYGSWHSADGFCYNMKPHFMVKDGGKTIAVVFYQSVKASTNEYIEGKVSLVFQNTQDFNSLITKLSDGTLKAKIANEKKQKSLFK